MRIAIITFFQSQDNYGQLLQCYAMQRTLRQMGHKPFLIRYGFHEKYFHWLKKKNLITKTGRHETFHQFKKLICHRNVLSERDFDSFRRKYLAKTFRCYNSLAELRRHPPKADCYIAGSDQVWAQLLSIEDNKSFYLDFGPQKTKRVSYAPSFAVDDYPSELKEKLAEQLSKFDAISVREQSGVKICKDVGYEASLVLDPTLLMTSEQYKELMKRPLVSNYCYVYHVNVTTKEELYWDEFTVCNKKNGLLSIAAFANPENDVNMEFLEGAEYVYPSIEEWLGYICCANYVLTSSFHGLVFSLIFHKPFVVCLRKNSIFAGNDRIVTLLKMFNLSQRIMHSGMDLENILHNPIDWDRVDSILNAQKKISFSFISNSLV